MSNSSQYYGYEVDVTVDTMETILRDVMMARNFAETHGFSFCVISKDEGARLNTPFQKALVDYLRNFVMVEREKCAYVWPEKPDVWPKIKDHEDEDEDQDEDPDDKNTPPSPSLLIIPHFVNDQGIAWDTYVTQYRQSHMISVPNFVNMGTLHAISQELMHFDQWLYSVVPVGGCSQARFYPPNDPALGERFAECEHHLVQKQFAYRFQRTVVETHGSGCHCIGCRLSFTLKDATFQTALCQLIGCRRLLPGETFLSLYQKDDFLSMHHDVGKGDIAVTLSLNPDSWDPVYGGLLHFCNEERKVVKTWVPEYGTLNVFKISDLQKCHHFVSKVNVAKKRITMSAWFTIAE